MQKIYTDVLIPKLLSEPQSALANNVDFILDLRCSI